MKKIITAILLGYLTIPVFSQNNTIKWQPASVKLDSNIANQADQPSNYDYKTKLAFDLKNDSNNLYMIFKISDQRTQFRIARAGMKIEFATSIKPKRKASIVFPSYLTEKSGMHNDNNNTGVKKERFQLKQKYLISPPVIQSSGFAFTNGNLSSDKSNQKMNYSVDWDTLNCMFIEFIIPLRELFGDHYDLKKITQKDINLKLQENALENPGFSGGESSGMGHGSGMGHNGGSGYHHGSKSGGTDESGDHQYGSGETQDRTSMFETQTLKQKFKLNSNIK